MLLAVIAGLSVAFIVLAGAIALEAARFVTENWPYYLTFWRQPREVRLKLALWASFFAIKVWIIWARLLLLYAILLAPRLVEEFVEPLLLYQSAVTLPIALTAITLMLWWTTDTIHGQVRGTRRFRMALALGGVAGSVTFSLILIAHR